MFGYEILPNWHPVFVHFTVALLTVSVVFYVLRLVVPAGRVRDEVAVVADWSLWLGAPLSIATVFAGWLAYNSVEHDEASHLAMTEHRNWGLATLAAFLVLGSWSAWNRWRGAVRAGMLFVILMIAAGGLLVGTAWRGGELVYRHGLGVLSLPAVEAQADGHDHEHVSAPASPAGKPAVPAKTGTHDHSTHKH